MALYNKELLSATEFNKDQVYFQGHGDNNCFIKSNFKVFYKFDRVVPLVTKVSKTRKCTTTMDKLNKAMTKETPLRYLYQNDPNIPIGVLGMIDNTLDIAECGNQSVAKNAVLNSFVENQRLQISHEKSAVIHIGNVSKCKQRCPKLKVHEQDMKTASSAKYLGDIVSGKTSVHDTIERRRNEGWGKVSQILGILNEVPTGTLRTQIGLKMRETKLCNNLLYNAGLSRSTSPSSKASSAPDLRQSTFLCISS